MRYREIAVCIAASQSSDSGVLHGIRKILCIQHLPLHIQLSHFPLCFLVRSNCLREICGYALTVAAPSHFVSRSGRVLPAFVEPDFLVFRGKMTLFDDVFESACCLFDNA